MRLQSLTATTREESGKGPARRIRLAGKVPGVLYGGGKGPVALALDLKEFQHLLHSQSGTQAVVQLEVKDRPDLNSPALLKSVDRHPVKDAILHADFQRIHLDDRIHTRVPVTLVGRAKGVAEGGVLEHHLRELEVECLALEVPDEVQVDITELDMGGAMHVAELRLPEGVTVLTEANRTVVAVHIPRVVAVAEAAEGEEEEGEEGEAKAEGEEGEAKEPQEA